MNGANILLYTLGLNVSIINKLDIANKHRKRAIGTLAC